MSTNCIHCVVNERTGPDLLCDDCRKNISLPTPIAGDPKEPVTGFGVGKDYSYFVDSEVGMTMDDTKVKQLPDGTWKASAKIGSIFGAEVEGELVGTGPTRKAALEALLKERKDLNDSLWA